MSIISDHLDVAHIAPDLRPLAVRIDDVIPDPENAKEHTDENRIQVRNLLIDYGQLLPIVVSRSTNHILKGNCTWEEAKALGWEYIAVLYGDFTPNQAASFAIRDNRVGELGAWKGDVLRDILGRLGDAGESIDAYGWKAEDLQRILTPTVCSVPPPVSTSFIDSLLTTANVRKSVEQLEAETGIRATLAPEDNAKNAKPIRVTPAQRETIDRAVEHMREETEDPHLTEGRAIELALADWLAGL